MGNWRTAQRLYTPLWCGQASYPPGAQARPWHRHWWGLGRAGAGLRNGDEKRFGSSTGNRIALCGVAVLVKSTNKSTSKKESDPYRQTSKGGHRQHCPALQPKAAQGLPKAPSIPTGNLQADLQGRAQADLQGRAQQPTSKGSKAGQQQSRAAARNPRQRLPRLPNPNPGTGAGAGTSI